MAETRRNRRWRTAGMLLLSVVALGSVAWTAWAYYVSGPASLGPEQPIPFSHRLHVSAKGIDCRFCHATVDRARPAGMPAVGVCLYCHHSIITEHPEIRKLQRYFDRGEPIPWVRVFWIPDHAHASHRVHLRAGLECEECHGDVGNMDRVKAPQVFEMGFCIGCHRDRKGPMDCVACHY